VGQADGPEIFKEVTEGKKLTKIKWHETGSGARAKVPAPDPVSWQQEHEITN
jgi:hypothetical protein